MTPGDALYAVEHFIEEAVRMRSQGEAGSHWPEYVYGDLLAEAFQGIEVLRSVV